MDTRGFDLREIAVEPGCARDYVAAEWIDTFVIVARGEIELEALCGSRQRFGCGDTLWLVGLPLRALHNCGQEPAVLRAISRPP